MGVKASKRTGKTPPPVRVYKHKHKKPVCGDSRHDLNYPEIPDSWGELFEIIE